MKKGWCLEGFNNSILLVVVLRTVACHFFGHFRLGAIFFIATGDFGRLCRSNNKHLLYSLLAKKNSPLGQQSGQVFFFVFRTFANCDPKIPCLSLLSLLSLSLIPDMRLHLKEEAKGERPILRPPLPLLPSFLTSTSQIAQKSVEKVEGLSWKIALTSK